MKLVQLFKTPNAFYAFDAPMGKMIEVSEELYKYLETNQTGTEDAPEEFKLYSSQGFFRAESPVKQISHPYTKILDTYVERKLSKITLQLTQQCNFRCNYCIYSEDHSKMQRSHSNKKMDFSVAKKAVDFLWEHSVDSPDANIGFYGGEPLLVFDLIKQVIEYSKELFYGKLITYNITTNGSLLEDDVVDYLVENGVSLMISLDGPKSIHDSNRHFANGRGTYDDVMAKIQRIKERHPAYWKDIQYSMVMDPANDFDEISKICNEESIVSKNVTASMLDQDYDGIVPEASDEYIRNYEYGLFLAYLAHWKRYPEDKVSPISLHRVESSLGQMYHIDMMGALRDMDVPAGPCVPGMMRLFIDVDGQLFPCERVSEQSDAMKIGHLDSGFEAEKVRQLIEVGQITEEACRNCWCFRLCNQCAKKADEGNDNLSSAARLRYCKYSRSDAYNKLQEYLFVHEVPEYYKEQIRLDEEWGKSES